MKKHLTKFVIVLDVLACLFLFVAYGPVSTFRNWLVTTALTTASHQYLAYILYSPEMVEDIMADNQVIVSGNSTDETLINLSTEDTGYYENEYERQILEHDENELYKVIEISGNGYSGWITVIYDPQRLHLAVSDSDNGQKVSDMAEECDAMVAINGGGFAGKRGEKSSYGGLVADGEVYAESYGTDSLVTMTNDGKLVLTYGEAEELENTEWAVCFSPFLIVNGERTEFTGNAGGQQPRTAIGQRSDGIVLLVTIEGRGANGSFGINYSDLTDIFERYGCINAANLDGGGSTTLVVEQRVVNNPVSFGKEGERKVFDAIVYY